MSAALEIGKLCPGTTELMFSGNGSSYEGWTSSPNEVGGIGVRHTVYNASDKSMKYITFVYVPYNRVGDPVASKVGGDVEARGKLTGPLEPNGKANVEWKILWYNPTIAEVKLKEVIVQYMDGTEETIKGEDILDIDSPESVYYQKRGKQERASAAEKAAENEKRKN